MIGAELQKADGTFKGDVFLIDSGADRTIITADLLSDLGCPAYQPTAHPGMIGLGGAANFQSFRSTLRLSAPNGDVFPFSAEFLAATDPAGLDLCLLGRDVLDQFDVILSQRNDEVLLLADSHRYYVIP